MVASAVSIPAASWPSGVMLLPFQDTVLVELVGGLSWGSRAPHAQANTNFRAPEGFTDFGKSIPTAASEILKLPITTRKNLEGSSTPRKEALNPEHCENTNYAPDILKPTTRNYATNPEPATPRCCSTVSPSKSS